MYGTVWDSSDRAFLVVMTASNVPADRASSISWNSNETTTALYPRSHHAAMPRRDAHNATATKWAIGLIPIIIFGLFGFVKYVLIAHLCIDYLYREKHRHATAIALIIIYLTFFILAILAYARTFYTAQRDPGVVPYSDQRKAAVEQYKTLSKRERRDLEEQPEWRTPDLDPDSPGLEAFYTKEMFICESDGRPRWCSICWQWKPDRAHHSSDLGRCVRKMDHLCPWVGGMVSETSFNFFFQFTLHCFICLSICFGTCAYCLAEKQREQRPLDGVTVAIIALSALFGIFTFGMTMTNIKFIFENITNVDLLRKRQVYDIAVRVPLDSPSTSQYWTVTYPLPRPTNMVNGLDVRAIATRDNIARRTFAILRTKEGENPWDLGSWRNFKSVMGNNVLEWFLPIKHSPCCNHESPLSDYQFGPLIDELKHRYDIPSFKEDFAQTDGIELREASPALP